MTLRWDAPENTIKDFIVSREVAQGVDVSVALDGNAAYLSWSVALTGAGGEAMTLPRIEEVSVTVAEAIRAALLVEFKDQARGSS